MSLYDPKHTLRDRDRAALALVEALFGKTLDKAKSVLQMNVTPPSYFKKPSLEILVGAAENNADLENNYFICESMEDLKMVVDGIMGHGKSPEIKIRINPSLPFINQEEDITRITIGVGSIIMEPLPNPDKVQFSRSLKTVAWPKDDDPDMLFDFINPVVTKAVRAYSIGDSYALKSALISNFVAASNRMPPQGQVLPAGKSHISSKNMTGKNMSRTTQQPLSLPDFII